MFDELYKVTRVSIGRMVKRAEPVCGVKVIGKVSGVTTEAFAVVESHCGELDLPTGTDVRAWWCVTPP
jgi:hypothetical protein